MSEFVTAAKLSVGPSETRARRLWPVFDGKYSSEPRANGAADDDVGLGLNVVAGLQGRTSNCTSAHS